MLLDPGIGFGKTLEHNLLLLGTSTASWPWAGRSCSARRASGSWARSSTPSRRTALFGTVATTVMGALAGAAVFRVHDVRPNVEALRVTEAVRRAGDG